MIFIKKKLSFNFDDINITELVGSVTFLAKLCGFSTNAILDFISTIILGDYGEINNETKGLLTILMIQIATDMREYPKTLRLLETALDYSNSQTRKQIYKHYQFIRSKIENSAGFEPGFSVWAAPNYETVCKYVALGYEFRKLKYPEKNLKRGTRARFGTVLTSVTEMYDELDGQLFSFYPKLRDKDFQRMILNEIFSTKLPRSLCNVDILLKTRGDQALDYIINKYKL